MKQRGRSPRRALVHAAALVYKDFDWRAVEKFIALEQECGREKVEQAAAIIRAKDVDNPQHCVGYFIGIIKNLK